MDHDWLLQMLEQRIDDRAFLGLIRKWLKAGILETDGKVIHPVCAFRYRDDAERFYKVLPKRLKKFGLEAAADKTRLLRFSQYHIGLQRRFTFLGFEFYWKEDHKGNPCVARRTAPKKLQAACQRIKVWIKRNRHLRGKEFFRGLNRRLRGHYNYYGIIGNSRAITHFYFWSLQCTFKWLNRRGGKRMSYDKESFKVILKHIPTTRHASLHLAV